MIYESGGTPSDEDWLGLRTQRSDPQDQPRGSMTLQRMKSNASQEEGRAELTEDIESVDIERV